MASNSQPAIGIDLGTTYSVIARLDESGRPLTIPNSEGDLVTPSIVLVDAKEVIVGKEAMKALSTEAEKVADCPKRAMGDRHYPGAIAGQQFPPEVLQAFILRKLANDCQAVVGEFKQAVITVPAYFDEVRRKATCDAAYMAGLELLDLINEPTAAAVAFGYQQGFLNPEGKSQTRQNILVYDLGGGTFDVTIMELNGAEFRTLATDGDVRLGGRDWDQRLMNLVSEQFQREHGLDPRHDPSTAGELWRDCEDAKRTLSARKQTTISCRYQGRNVRCEVTREQFEEMTRDLLERTQFTTRSTLKEAGLDWGSVARVLMVGGSSRMPAVRQMLKNLTGKEPEASVSADEAVAHGAALHAGFLQARREGRPSKLNISNVNSHSLGVVGTDPKTGRPRSVALIPRNTQLPAAAKRVFKTQNAGQKSILVRIVEGESPSPDACVSLGKCVVRNLPPNLPARTPIEVEFRYGSDGRLNVAVKVADTNVKLAHEIQREVGLSQAELEAWAARVRRGSLG